MHVHTCTYGQNNGSMMSLQEQRDAELARTLGGGPVGQDQLNDLGS